MSRREAGVLALLVSAGLARAAGPGKPIRSDAHLHYQPIESAEARALLDRALAFSRRRLGEPAIPVQRVRLLRSEPRDPEAELRRGFQFTEITDSEKGEFAIYLSARPGETAFEGQLAHEAFHLQNARLRDVHVEGLCCFLAEEFLEQEGLPWAPWLRHFEGGKDPLYAAAYSLMRDLAREAGRERLLALVRSAVESAGKYPWMEIDIDHWLAALPEPERRRAAALLLARHAEVDRVRKREQPELAYRRPGVR